MMEALGQAANGVLRGNMPARHPAEADGNVIEQFAFMWHLRVALWHWNPREGFLSAPNLDTGLTDGSSVF